MNREKRSIRIEKHRYRSVIRALAGAILLLLFWSISGTVPIDPVRSETLKPTTQPETGLKQDLERIKEKVRRVEFPNGLRLLMMKRSYAPTVALYIKFLAGGSDETTETAGIAHMLEHMLFKGTRRIGTRDYPREEKYIKITNLWASRLDKWRLRLEEAQAEGDQAAIGKAEREVAKWQKRLKDINAASRQFIILNEDSHLYSLHGQRGYNAYTSRDLTNYQIELPSNRLEVWARMESDRFKNSVLRDFYTERDVVAEERRMRTDNVAQNLLLEQYLEKIYGGHPYGQSLIGSMKSIQFLNYEQAYQFYKTYYSPNNMVIAIVGDVDFEKTEALVRKYFGDMEPKKIQRRKIPPPGSQKGLLVELKKEGSPFQLLSWFKPPMPSKDDLSLEVLSRILAGRRDSRLYKRLVVKDRVAAQINIYSGFPGERYTNLFMVLGVPAPNRSYDELKTALLREITEIRNNGVTEEELERVRQDLLASFIYSLRSNATMADRLSYYETVTGNYEDLFDSYEELEGITPEKIQEAALRYLDPNLAMEARLLPPD